jgi:hypothetical protein
MNLILRHHDAVGIRASIVCSEGLKEAAAVVERNWDVVTISEDPEMLEALYLQDGRDHRGFYAAVSPPGEPANFLYRLINREDVLTKRCPDLSTPLPVSHAPADPDGILQKIEEVVVRGQWMILRMDEACFTQLSIEGHKRLLQYLGDLHARIWCAPIRDIACWKP